MFSLPRGGAECSTGRSKNCSIEGNLREVRGMASRLRVAAWVLLSCLASGLAPAPSHADDISEMPSFLHLSGFGTLGLTTSDNHDYALLRDQSSGKGISAATAPLWADSRLGLQMDAEITPDLTATIQGVFQKDPSVDFDNTLQWAFLKYQPVSWLQLRVGRMGADSFMLSDLRNVGFTYNWVRPPVEFYGLFPVYSYDGADATYRARLSDDWSFELEGLYGVTRFVITEVGSKTSDLKFPVFWGGNAVLRNDDWTFRLSGLRARFGDTLPQIMQVQSALQSVSAFLPSAENTAGALSLQGAPVRFYSAGIGYDDGTWTGQTEYARTECGCQLIRGNNAAYGIIGRHFGEWTPFLSYSKVLQDNAYQPISSPLPVPQIEALFGGVNTLLHSGHLDQDDRTAGLRWNFSAKADLKLQYDNYHVRNFSILWRSLNTLPAGGSGSINVFSASLDFIF
jgi:hypothetical protein